MREIARILKKGGTTIFSDILEQPNLDKTKLKDVYSRLGLESLGNKEMYDEEL